MSRANRKRGYLTLFVGLLTVAVAVKGFLFVTLRPEAISGAASFLAVVRADVVWLAALGFAFLGLDRIAPSRWLAARRTLVFLVVLFYLANAAFVPQVGKLFSWTYLVYLGDGIGTIVQPWMVLAGLTSLVGAAGIAMALVGPPSAVRARDWLVPGAAAALVAGLSWGVTPGTTASAFAPQPLVYFGGSVVARLHDDTSSEAGQIAQNHRRLATLEGLPSLAGANLVVIVLESTGSRYAMGEHDGKLVSPYLADLAGRSVSFPRAYTNSTDSVSAFAPLFLSTWWVSDRYRALLRDGIGVPSWGEVLVDAGYETALFSGNNFFYGDSIGIMRRFGFRTVRHSAHYAKPGQMRWNFDDLRVVPDALQWMADRGGERFCLLYWTSGGHWPWEDDYARDEFGRETELGRHLNLLRHQDRVVEALVRGVERLGLERDTLFVILGDHGDGFGPNLGGDGHPGRLTYEEIIRVPLLFHHPRWVGRAGAVPVPAQHVDVGPTVLGALGLTIPDAWQGRDLLSGGPVADIPVYAWARDDQIAAIRGDTKVILNTSDQRLELYDLATDPDERVDLSDRPPAAHLDLAKTLRAFRRAQARHWRRLADER